MKKMLIFCTVLFVITKTEASNRPEMDYYFNHKESVATGIHTMAATMGFYFTDPTTPQGYGMLKYEEYGKHDAVELKQVLLGQKTTTATNPTNDQFVTYVKKHCAKYFPDVSFEDVITQAKEGPVSDNFKNVDSVQCFDQNLNFMWWSRNAKPGERGLWFRNICFINSNNCWNLYKPINPPVIIRKDTSEQKQFGDYESETGSNSSSQSQSVSKSESYAHIDMTIHQEAPQQNTQQDNCCQEPQRRYVQQDNCCTTDNDKPKVIIIKQKRDFFDWANLGLNLVNTVDHTKDSFWGYDINGVNNTTVVNNWNWGGGGWTTGNPNQGSTGGSQTGSSGTDPGDSGGQGNNNGPWGN